MPMVVEMLASEILVARVLVAVSAAYLLTGLALGLVFIFWHVDNRDASAHGAYAFRPLLLPGMALLWPVVLANWNASPQAGLARRHRQVHRVLWIVLGVILVAVLAQAWVMRATMPPEGSSIRLALPER